MDINGTNNPRTNGLSFEISHFWKGLVTWQRLRLRSFLSNHGLDAQVNVLAVWSCCKSRVIQNAIQKSRSSRGLYLVNAVMFPTNYQMLLYFFTLCLEMLFLDYLMIIWRSPFLSGTSLIRSEKFSGGRLSKTTPLVNTYTAANDELRFLLNNY